MPVRCSRNNCRQAPCTISISRTSLSKNNITHHTALTMAEPTTETKQKKESFPPKGYICKLCGVEGHWIQQCPQKPNKKRKRKKSSQHEYVPGINPSPEDIEKSKQMQRIPRPLCDCGIPSRLKKVKKSRVMENSRANGSYFFFCSKQKNDETKCAFARPVEEETKTEREKRTSNFFARKRKTAAGGASSTYKRSETS